MACRIELPSGSHRPVHTCYDFHHARLCGSSAGLFGDLLPGVVGAAYGISSSGYNAWCATFSKEKSRKSKKRLPTAKKVSEGHSVRLDQAAGVLDATDMTTQPRLPSPCGIATAR